MLSSAIISLAGKLIRPALALAAGPVSAAIKEAWQLEGVDCRILPEDATETDKVDVAISAFAITNDSPSRSKRHVERLTSASDLVLFSQDPVREVPGLRRMGSIGTNCSSGAASIAIIAALRRCRMIPVCLKASVKESLFSVAPPANFCLFPNQSGQRRISQTGSRSSCRSSMAPTSSRASHKLDTGADAPRIRVHHCR